MATSLLDRILQYFRSPQGKKLAANAQAKAERLAKDPRTQRAIKKAQDRVQAAASDPRTQARVRSFVSKINKR
ncbi:hypothetical protein ABZV93_25060 [Actinopolymorpha sp. NPDC004070]|uniref:hypothetical protein n=1 Tax=Actinopolymorpha sp. NPDC004070 TaxID=3154548 RepID=UPI0033B6EAFA